MNARKKPEDPTHSLDYLRHEAVVYVCAHNTDHRLTMARGSEKPETRKCPDCGGAFDMLPLLYEPDAAPKA